MRNSTRLATVSLATLEAVRPPYNLRDGNPAENRERGIEIADAAGHQRVDLVCLPETFTLAGMGAVRADYAEPLEGQTVGRLSQVAKRFGMYIVAGLLCETGGVLRNVAVMLDRNGDLVTTYSKMHLTPGELNAGIVPGTSVVTAEADFGRIGFAICFDLNWPGLWADLKAQGADLVCWPSAYDGGFPLRAYSWLHRYTVVSSVLSYQARIIDPLARVLASTSRWARLAYCDVDLRAPLFHTDGQAEKIIEAQRVYGDRICVRALGDEHLFSIAIRDEDLSHAELVDQLGLVTLEAYLSECESSFDGSRSTSTT